MKKSVAPDLVRAAEVIAERGGRLGAPLSIEEETGSTNDDAKAGARSGAPHGAVWLAESQHAGRGRQGRAWVSPRGENLLFSVLLRVTCPPARVPPLSLAAGLAVRDAVAKAVGSRDAERVLVKWPNDVVVRRPDGSLRKLAGILIESSVSGMKVEHVIVGIGINVHTRAFPEELEPIATSIALEAGTAAVLDRADILADVLAGLDRDLEHVAARGLGLVHARLLAHDALRGQPVASDDGALRGTAAGIDLEGRLRIERESGEIATVTAGEVRLAPGGRR
ncbi:MAG: biotin--[acetyl-CoA-carboxylase] ligase [Deltaproteobacteria bacterium]|nr:biotin--[acetyl-CoA-carboxylase] ligase [Deltaproteobacteria bacterium]